MNLPIAQCLIGLCSSLPRQGNRERPRLRDMDITVGELPTGEFNAITDVSNVKVGHVTLVEGDAVRTSVTVVLPHGGNLFQEKVSRRGPRW
jgi:D-aminopeptidase